jgi:hypothetical protein
MHGTSLMVFRYSFRLYSQAIPCMMQREQQLLRDFPAYFGYTNGCLQGKILKSGVEVNP